MFTKSFDAWLEEHEYAWIKKFDSKDAISKFISEHTARGTKIGRVLAKMKLDWQFPQLPDHIVNENAILQAGVLAFNAREYVAKVELVSDAATVSEAYKNIKSCMVKHHEGMAQFLADDLLIEQGIRLAVYRHKDEVVGRCIVNTATQGMLPIYSSVGTQEFGVALGELGYLPAEYTKGVLKGCKLPWTNEYLYFDETGDSLKMYRIAGENWWFMSELNVLWDDHDHERLSPTEQGHVSLLDDERFQQNIQELSEETGFEIDPRKLEACWDEVGAEWLPLMTDEIQVARFNPVNRSWWAMWYESLGRRLWYHVCLRRDMKYHFYGYMDDFGDLQVAWLRQEEVAN